MSTATKAKVTVILANLGTPDAPTASAVRLKFPNRFGKLFSVYLFCRFARNALPMLMRWCGAAILQCEKFC